MMNFRHSFLAMLLIVVGLCATASSQARNDRKPDHVVTMRKMAYSPTTLKIRVGQTVRWINSDEHDHTVVADDRSFRSPNIPSGKSFDHRFTKAGKYSYRCTYHPRMKGVVIVE